MRSFAGEGLERERFAEHVAMSHKSGISFAQAKAMLESLNRRADCWFENFRSAQHPNPEASGLLHQQLSAVHENELQDLIDTEC